MVHKYSPPYPKQKQKYSLNIYNSKAKGTTNVFGPFYQWYVGLAWYQIKNLK